MVAAFKTIRDKSVGLLLQLCVECAQTLKTSQHARAVPDWVEEAELHSAAGCSTVWCPGAWGVVTWCELTGGTMGNRAKTPIMQPAEVLSCSPDQLQIQISSATALPHSVIKSRRKVVVMI